MSEDNNVQVSDETRAKVAEELGLDQDTQSELIEKLAVKETTTQQDLSRAIQKKADYRDAGVKAGILDPETFKPIERKPDGTSQTLKTNENLGLSREEAILIAQGMKQEELDYLNKIKGDKSYLEAKESDDFKNWVAGRKANEVKEASQLDASGKAPIGSPPREKPVSELSDDEFKADYGNIVDKALNG